MNFQSAQEFIRLRLSDNLDDQREAAHGTAATEVWMQVLRDRPDLAYWVAQNKTVPMEVLRFIALSDLDTDARRMVALKRKATPDLLDLLSADPDESVRRTVARHRNASDQTLLKLASDPDQDVREIASDRIGSH